MKKEYLLFPLTIFLLLSLFWRVRSLRANYDLNLAERFRGELSFPQAFFYYEEALKRGGHLLNPYIRYRYGLSALLYAQVSEYLQQKPDLKIIQRAINLQDENQRKEWPFFVRNYLLKGELATIAARYDSKYVSVAQNSFSKMERFNPQRPGTYLALAQLAERLGETEKARGLINRALEINRLNTAAMWELAILEIQEGNLNKAQSLYFSLSKNGFPIFKFPNLIRLVTILRETGNEKEAAHWNRMIVH